MPFDPTFPPDDPWQWWRTRAQPRFLQPNAPASGASGDPAGPDGIDDWFVPGQPPKPADSPGTALFSAGSDGYPDDWIYPHSWNAPPATSPSMAPPAPSPPIGAFNPGISNPPLPPTDPFAAYWSTIPASRLAAVAWAPPIFPDASGRFQLTRPAPAAPDLPLTLESGLLGGVARMLAERAAGTPSFGAGHDLLGGIARLPAASAPRDVWSDGAGQGLLGGIANLPGANTYAPAPPLGHSGGAPSGFGGLPWSPLNDLLNPQWPPAPIGWDGFGSSSAVGNTSRSFPFPSEAPFDASPNLIPPPPSPPSANPTVFPFLQRTESTLGDGNRSAPQSGPQRFGPHDLFASAYMSGGVADSPTGPFDPRAWGWIHQAADREKVDPEEIWDPLAPLRADLYNTARYNLREIQPNNYALSVPSLRMPGGAPTREELGELIYAYRTAQSTQPLAETASRIAGLIEPFAQNRRTVSVLQTSRGTLIAGSGKVDLEPDQTAAVKAAGAMEVPKAGVDAEVTALEYAENRRELPQFIAASRPFCDACRKEIRDRGGLITSPTTAVFPPNIPWGAFPSRWMPGAK